MVPALNVQHKNINTEIGVMQFATLQVDRLSLQIDVSDGDALLFAVVVSIYKFKVLLYFESKLYDVLIGAKKFYLNDINHHQLV